MYDIVSVWGRHRVAVWTTSCRCVDDIVPLARVPVSSLWMDWISFTSPSRQRLGQPAILVRVPRLPRKIPVREMVSKTSHHSPPGRSGVPSQRDIDSLYRLDIYSAIDPVMTENRSFCFISLFSSAGNKQIVCSIPKILNYSRFM